MDAARVFLVCINGYALDKQRSERNMSGLTSELWMSRLVIIFVKWVEKYFQLVSEESFANQKKVFKENSATTLSENHVVRTKVSSACRDCIVTVLKFLLAGTHRWPPAFSNLFFIIFFFFKSDSKAFSAFSRQTLFDYYRCFYWQAGPGGLRTSWIHFCWVFCSAAISVDPHPIFVTSRKK